MNNKFGTDMTTGSIPRHLLSFAIPMLVGNLMQVGYSIINTIWVGNIVGKDAIGATAVSFPIIFILIGLASGATMATTILVSQYFGAKNFPKVESVVNNSFSIALILGTVLTIAGVFSSNLLLRMMDTPEEIFALASSYLKISLAGFLLMYFSFLISSILRGIGDTKTPLAFMGAGLVLNAILDPLMIIGIGPFPKMGLNGAAYASIIAQGGALIVGLIYINRKNPMVAFNIKKLSLEKEMVGLIFKIGFPSIIQQSLVSIGAAFITSFVNWFGASAINAFGAAGRIDAVAFMPAMSLSLAASALTGQNLGAGKPERVKEIFKWGVIMTSVITIAISILALSFPHYILSVFGLNGKDLEIGVSYLKIVGASYIFFAIMFVSNGVINGAGHTMITMIFSLFSLWIVRVPLAALLSGWAYETTSGSKYAIVNFLRIHLFSRFQYGLTGIWIAMMGSFMIIMIVSLVYYFSGKWKKTVIRARPVED